jgi:hypothetical protein
MGTDWPLILATALPVPLTALVAGLGGRYLDWFGLRGENNRLRQENAKLTFLTKVAIAMNRAYRHPEEERMAALSVELLGIFVDDMAK